MFLHVILIFIFYLHFYLYPYSHIFSLFLYSIFISTFYLYLYALSSFLSLSLFHGFIKRVAKFCKSFIYCFHASSQNAVRQFFLRSSGFPPFYHIKSIDGFLHCFDLTSSFQVIKNKQWSKITRGLNLPASITSAAFTLRTQ